jgi:broad specificity phosphatase PhoE
MRRLLVGALVLVALAGSAPAAERVILVRHAEKEAGDDPGLTALGAARARALAEAVGDLEVAAILVSPTRRTRDTATPAAESLGVALTEIGFDGGLEKHVSRVAWACADTEGTVLVVGHSNTVPRIAGSLLGREIPDLDEREYDTLFLVLGDRLVRVRFGPEDGFPAEP